MFEENEVYSHNDPESLSQKLAAWAVKRNIRHNALDELLGILREQPCGAGLPKVAHTLLGTIRDVPIHKVSPGYYFHFGILEGIKSIAKFIDIAKDAPKNKIFCFC